MPLDGRDSIEVRFTPYVSNNFRMSVSAPGLSPTVNMTESKPSSTAPGRRDRIGGGLIRLFCTHAHTPYHTLPRPAEPPD